MIYFLDNVLVAVAYYIGYEKKFNGAFPFIILAFLTTIFMISSEIIAITMKKKGKKPKKLRRQEKGLKGKSLQNP